MSIERADLEVLHGFLREYFDDRLQPVFVSIQKDIDGLATDLSHYYEQSVEIGRVLKDVERNTSTEIRSLNKDVESLRFELERVNENHKQLQREYDDFIKKDYTELADAFIVEKEKNKTLRTLLWAIFIIAAGLLGTFLWSIFLNGGVKGLVQSLTIALEYILT